MARWGAQKKILLPLTAAVASFFSTSPLLAKSKSDQSFIRSYTWEGSLDTAGDATYQAEKALSSGGVACQQFIQQQNQLGKQVDQAYVDECKRTVAQMTNQAKDVKEQQRIMADVSKVSDVAAIGAIGAVGYSEFIQKKTDQSDTYRSAAKVQKTAGTVSYVAGATDLALGAVAYVHQKEKLEEIQRKLDAAGKNNSASSAVSKAAEATKQAAMNHMLMGAGKLAVGYASMKLAKRSQKQAAEMKSLTPMLSSMTAQQSNAALATGGGTPPAVFHTNQPSFSIPTSTVTSTGTGSGGGSSGSFAGGSGSSAMLSDNVVRMPSSKGGSGVGGGGGGSGAGGGGFSGAGGGGGGEASAAGGEDAGLPVNAMTGNNGSFEVSRAGGGWGFSGGGGGKDSDSGGGAGLGDLVGGLMGGNAGGTVAGGINPDQMYEEAQAGANGGEQGSMIGVNGSKDQTLFQAVKSRHIRALRIGNLQGPASVEVRN